MFWGLNLKPNRKYTQTATKAFHISSAALDGTTSKGGPTQIYISSESDKFLVCTLQKDGPLQVMLDLNFNQGEDICFQSVGSGNVSLTGYVNEDFEYDYDGEEEEDAEGSVTKEEMADLRKALTEKREKKVRKAAEIAKQSLDDEDDDSDSDDPDFNGVVAEDMDEDDDSDELGEEEEAGDDDDDDEDDEDEVEDQDDDGDESEEEELSHAKKRKIDGTEKLQNGKVSSKNQKEQNKKNQQEKQKQQNKKNDSGSGLGVEKTITGGVKIVDIREGQGPEARVGKKALVYYEGRLKSNNKLFDSLKNGAGFKFSLGRGEVIKGWDIGVCGMKVGGKRRITCPPHMAYGNKGAPPTIPPNSTLVFDVELKGVN